MKMRIVAILLFGGAFLMTAATTHARERGKLIVPESEDWIEWTSVEDFLEHCPGRYETLINALDTDHPGLKKVKEAIGKGDKAAACKALLAYYAGPGRQAWLVERLGEPSEKHVKRADLAVNNRHLAGGGIVGDMPVRHGAWDWNYGGPKKDREYAFNLNRHQFFPHLYQAWKMTGDEKYAATFDRIVRDWILHAPYPGNQKDPYTYQWRVLEAGLRMRSWTLAFHAFADAKEFSPAGRLLMLSSFVEHGAYIKKLHWRNHNHALMEHDGLNRLGLALPGFKDAEEWHRYAFKQMLREMDVQVYPDGAHNELSSGYHWVSLNSYEEIAEVTEAAGGEVPDAYRSRLIDMYDYWAGLVRPDGSLPQNNRADRGIATDRLLKAAERYDRPDWRYIATNGREGTAPEGLPSRFAPWAGHLVNRSGWEADALWSFFDAGPAGHGLVHQDALHLSVSAYGKDFLIDSGRFWYMGGQWKSFAHSSRSHNVILIDGKDQGKGPTGTRKPYDKAHWAVTERFDFARKTHDAFDKIEGKASHTRTVVFIKEPGCWAVLDRIETDRPRTLTAMWRFRPEREVKIDDAGNLVTADAKGANLALIPLGNSAWAAKLLRGQEKPYTQGWHSDFTPNWVPNTCAEFTAKIDKSAAFAWLVVPTREGSALIPSDTKLTVEDKAAEIRFAHPAGREWALRIPLDQGLPSITQRNEGE